MCPEVEKEMEKLGEVTKFCNLCRRGGPQEKVQIAFGGGSLGVEIAKFEKSILNYLRLSLKIEMIISWSLLRAFEQCPYQQKLIRIDKVGPKRIDERRFITGSVGHKFFEIWAKRGFDNEINPAAAGRIFDKLIHRKFIRWHNESDCGETRERVIKEASLLIEAVRHNGIDKINDAQIECFLLKSLPDGQNFIGGIIDLIANNGSWIIELKMSADLKWADPGQLIYYGLMIGAIQRKYPRRLSFFLPLIPNFKNQITDIEFTKHDFFIIYDRINRLIALWNEGNFTPTVDLNTCHFCDVKEYCPSSPSHVKN